MPLMVFTVSGILLCTICLFFYENRNVFLLGRHAKPSIVKIKFAGCILLVIVSNDRIIHSFSIRSIIFALGYLSFAIFFISSLLS